MALTPQPTEAREGAPGVRLPEILRFVWPVMRRDRNGFKTGV